MCQLLQKLTLGVSAVGEHDFGDFAADHLSAGVDHLVAPASLDGGNDLWLAEDVMAGTVGIEHHGAQVAQIVGDHALAAANAADEAQDKHGGIL
jgi:hypothetical protein